MTGVAARVGAAASRIAGELDVIVARDPSVRSRGEALLHPSVLAIGGHRVSSRLYRRGRYKGARLVSVFVRVLSGVEIHPGARIGRRCFIDHGSGVVIGETAVLGDDVTIFHQVTLGSTGWWHDPGADPSVRRHPALGDGVTVGANATVLGPVVIGDHAVIGAQALVTGDVPGNVRVRAPRGAVAEADASSRPTGSRRHNNRPPVARDRHVTAVGGA